MSFRRLRIFGLSGIGLICIAAAIKIALLQTQDPGLVFALAIVGILTQVEPIFALWDRFVVDKELTPKRSPQPASEAMYLEGRLREFEQEEKWFIALAGDAVIESRFDEYLPGESLEKREPFTDIAQAATHFNNRFVLVGDPGAGKSTSLRHLAREQARAYQQADGQGIRLPLWINMGLGDNPVDVDELLNFWLTRYKLPHDLETYLIHNNLTLYLDGLNEMPEQTASCKIHAEKLRTWLEKHPTIPAILTCRVRDYDDDLKLGLPVVEIRPLDEGRIREFIAKRLGDERLWGKIKDDEAQRRMAQNPYNLAMLTGVFKERGELPADLNQLYAMYVRARYDEYAKTEGKKPRLGWDTLERRLQRLAFRMIVGGKGTAADVRWAQRQIGKKALRDGIDLGVLVQNEDNIRFYHQSLHGYFSVPLLKNFLDVSRPTNLVRLYRGLNIAITSIIVSSLLLSILGFLNAAVVLTLFLCLLLLVTVEWRRLNLWPRQFFLLGEGLPPVMHGSAYVLRSTEMNIRAGVVLLLMNIGEPAIPMLVTALRDADENVIQTASIALIKMGEPAIPALIEALQDADENVQKLAFATLEEIGEPAIPALIEALHDADEDVRKIAAAALTGIGVSAIPALAEVLRDTNENVQELAAAAFEEIGESAIPALAEALCGTGENIQNQAAVTLKRIGEPAIPALIEALHDTDEYVQTLATVALGKIGEPAIPALIEALRDADENVQNHALVALKEIGELAISALVEVLFGSDKDLQFQIFVGGVLGEIGRTSLLASIQRLRDANEVTALAELKTYCEHKIPEWIEHLDHLVRKEGLEALDRSEVQGVLAIFNELDIPEALAAVEEFRKRQK